MGTSKKKPWSLRHPTAAAVTCGAAYPAAGDEAVGQRAIRSTITSFPRSAIGVRPVRNVTSALRNVKQLYSFRTYETGKEKRPA
jgi:hypothetical protein